MSLLNFHYDSGAFFDEMFASGNGGAIRPHYRRLAERLSTLAEADFEQRRAALDLAFLRRGVTFTVYSDSQGTERIFPFDLIPRVIPAAEWKRIEAGPQAGPERGSDPEYRRPHDAAASAGQASCTGFAPQRGARATRRNPSISTTSSRARS